LRAWKKFIILLVLMNDYVYNLGLMKAIAETNSLEGWTKMTDNTLCEYHDDTEGIKFISQLITQIINVALIISDDNDSETRPNVDRNIDNHSLTVNDDDKIDDKKVIKNF